MKIFKRFPERRMRELVNVDTMQLGFMRGRGTTEAMFAVRKM